ncbi:MAG: hypothetical protein GWN14_03390 [candidate division Zixibacteria bacterium]|nr:hypothetical protein [candidate division Zixibacteria bacterium]
MAIPFRAIQFTVTIVWAVLLGACSHAGKPQILPHSSPYFKVGQHYSFALYNSDNRLITHPLENWLKASREAEFHGEPYTDLYIMTHGWNFTHQEAMAMYNRYLKVWDRKTYGARFKPYIIFILWNSTTRPFSENARALLFFGMDEATAVFNTGMDNLIHTLTAWKQSINAHRNALGTDSPKLYAKKTISNKSKSRNSANWTGGIFRFQWFFMKF